MNRKIEDVIETRLGPGFVKEKQNYKLLKTIVNDIVNSAVVEGRRAPMTLPEQIGTIEAIVEGISNPLSATRKAFAKEIGEMNTRGGSWKQLIDLYDQEAIKSAKVIKKPVGKTIKKPPSNTNPLDFSKNKGGFINPRKIAEDTGIMAKPKYKTAMDALNDPEFQAKYAAIEARRKILKPTKTSNNLYHTTRAENIESIMKQ